MISTEIKYETHNSKLRTIIEAFKTSKYHLEESQYEVLVFTDHNNLRWFMNTKSLSSKQVCWAQELSYYHFWVDYCQGKANRATNALFQYPQQSVEEEKTFWVENVKILYRL